MGSEQCAVIRAALAGGPPDGTTHIRFEIIDLVSGMSFEWTSEEVCARGESSTAYYQVTSLTENIFEKEHTVNIYADDGTGIGSWTGCIPLEFLPDPEDSED